MDLQTPFLNIVISNVELPPLLLGEQLGFSPLIAADQGSEVKLQPDSIPPSTSHHTLAAGARQEGLHTLVIL